MKVKDLLAGKDSEVLTVQPDNSIAELSALLAAHRVGAVPVTSAAGDLVGIISERDVAHGVSSHGARLGAAKVAELMTAEVITCEPENVVGDVVILMSSYGIRHLPVIEYHRLIGIISLRDVLDQRLAELELEVDTLRQQLVVAGDSC